MGQHRGNIRALAHVWQRRPGDRLSRGWISRCCIATLRIRRADRVPKLSSDRLRNIDSRDSMAGTAEGKSRGAFFTPAAIAGHLAEWAIREPSDRILEPSCGEAVFLSAAAERLNAINCEGVDWDAQLHGVDLHAESVSVSEQMLRNRGFGASLSQGDFFMFEPAERYDVIIGNPPFIRYQDFSGTARARSLEAALTQGVRLSGLASSWLHLL